MSLLCNNDVEAVLNCVFPSTTITNFRVESFLLRGCNLKGKDLSFSKPSDYRRIGLLWKVMQL